MTADLAQRLRGRSLTFKMGGPTEALLREAADALDTAKTLGVLFVERGVMILEYQQRIKELEAERDGYIAAWHGADARAAAASRVVEAVRETNLPLHGNCDRHCPAQTTLRDALAAYDSQNLNSAKEGGK